MGVLEQIARGAFAGEEFLTWLWYLSETRAEPIPIPKAGAVQIAMGQEIIMSGDGGDASTVVLRGDMPCASSEAREALAAGKRLKRAKIYFTIDTVQWGCTMAGASLTISGLRVPVAGKADFETMCSDRLDAVERVSRVVNWLFEHFLERRLNAARWQKERDAIAAWAEGK